MMARGVGVPTPLNESAVGALTLPGEALARHPDRRMAVGDETVIRRQCSLSVASAQVASTTRFSALLSLFSRPFVFRALQPPISTFRAPMPVPVVSGPRA